MWARAKAVGLVLAVSLTVLQFGGSFGGEVDAPPEKSSEVYLVSLPGGDSLEILQTLDVQVLEDYDNGYYLVRGGYNDVERLSGPDLSIRTLPERTMLKFPASGYEFDTLGSLPSIPPGLTATATDERIVQFIGPIRSEWTQELEDMGVHLEQYVDSFAFVAKMSDSQVELIRRIPFVGWIGTYEPAYKVQSELLDMSGIVPVSVIAHDGVDEGRLRGLLERIGAEVTATWTTPVTAEAMIEASLIPAVSQSPDVLNVFWSPQKEPLDWASGEIHRFHEAWMSLRSGIPWNLTGRSPGPDGVQGTTDDIIEVVGIQDTGFDANNANAGWDDLFQGPNGDRVISIRRRTAQCSQPDGRATGSSHGTAVVGAVLSNGFDWEHRYGLPTDDFAWDKSEAGVVPEGELSFDCIGQGNGVAASPSYWDDEYNDGAKTFSNSYGSANTVYDATATAADARMAASTDKMIIFATGNGGPEPHTTAGMAKAKNGLAIGASQNYRPEMAESNNPNLVADFSSRGNPSERFKPDLVTVGTSVVSGLGYGEWLYNAGLSGSGVPQPDYIMDVDVYRYMSPGSFNGDDIADYRYYTGTSMSAPQAAGMYMLTREYLREMHGVSNVSSQLAKAMLINGAVRMDPNLYEYPGIDQGWGRIDLEQSLFPPPPRSNQFEEGVFTTTGMWSPSTISMNVKSSDVPLKVTLVWIDQAGQFLVRDLDLIVRDPKGTYEYHGNQYAKSGPLKGWTDPSDSGFDIINNVEQVEVPSPSPGTWTVQVRGVRIPSATPFALVFSADVGPTRAYQVSLSTDQPTTLEVAPGGTTNLPFDVMNFGTNNDVISMSHDAPPEIEISFDWLNESFASGDTKANFATFTAASNASEGLHRFVICGISQNDTSIPPASDCISVEVFVSLNGLPPSWDVTAGDEDEMDPSVLTFSRGGWNHIFVAYKKVTPLNYSDLTHGGTNVWVAHNTINSSHVPNGTWTYTSVSDWNDYPNDLRLMEIDYGTFEGRVVLTWIGRDPNEADPNLRPYGRIAFSDPPYNMWKIRTIEKNYGSNVYNAPRVGFPLFRQMGPTGNGTLVWVWEHLDYLSVDDRQNRAVQTHATFSWDGGETWGQCLPPSDPNNKCYLIAPKGSTNYYFFPAGTVDKNDVLWVFFYWRMPTASQGRKLAAALWDGPSWNTSWTSPISILDPGGSSNIRYPAAVSTPEGGNRVYVAMTADNGSYVPERINVTFTEGTYGAGTIGPPPAPAPTGGVSPDFSSPQGPMGDSVLTSRYDMGPILNMVYTDDGLTWVPYMEKKSGLGGGSDLATWYSSDGFANRTVLNVTENPYGKGHAMADTLTTGSKSCVYEVWHESKGSFEKANYDIRLTIYCSGWPPKNDTFGPRTINPTTIPNPFNKTFSKSLKVLAQISDVASGYSNITAAELVLTDTTVSNPSAVDWTSAWTMNLTGVNRSPTETAWLWANETALSWPVHSCHRIWIRGQDSRGNWGAGAYVDVCVVETPVIPHAPEMKKAELTGVAYGDVTLTWSKSPDDGGGTYMVAKYKVSRSDKITGPFVVIANVTASGSPDYSWTDAGAGHGNSRQLFYHVVANSTYRDSAPTGLAGKFYRTMSGGKQLLSFPLLQANYDPTVVFQTFKYTYVRTYVAGTPNPWWCHKPGRFVNSLTKLSVEQGYWVDVDGPGTMTVAGLVAESLVMRLMSGWNMIGFPSFTDSYTFEEMNADIGGMLQLVEIHDPGAGPYYLQKVHRNAWSSTYLEAGYAYMVRVSNDVDWSLPSR